MAHMNTERNGLYTLIAKENHIVLHTLFHTHLHEPEMVTCSHFTLEIPARIITSSPYQPQDLTIREISKKH